MNVHKDFLPLNVFTQKLDALRKSCYQDKGSKIQSMLVGLVSGCSPDKGKSE